MVDVDAGRLKWDIIAIVGQYITNTLAEQFAQEFERLLQEQESQEIGVQHLIKTFRPALASVLAPGPDFDILMSEVSLLLNQALSGAEHHKIQSSLDEQEKTKVRSTPKSRVVQIYNQPDNLKMLSVGIDVGSSTSHLILSHLFLRRERSFVNPTNRFQVVDREIIYESNIIFTPLLDRNTIDIEAIVEFCKEEYQKAGITPDMVESGAVVVTGETAKKKNADEIVKRLSSESGKFVSAAAGPNYESVLGIMGSGIVDISSQTGKTILHVDIGGGTSNLAIASKGHIHCTACTNVGGRLLGIDKDFKIWRKDGPTVFLMQELGMNYEIGDIIPEDDVRTISKEYAKALIEAMQGPAKSRIAKELMMTDDLDFSLPIDEVSFSGGVAEHIYGSVEKYDDIGVYLAEEIISLAKELEWSIIEPENKIRATVIGAGAFTLSVSGSTCYFDKSIEFPIRNIPVIPINVTTKNYRPGIVGKEIASAFAKYDMIEGTDLVGLYFMDSLYRSYTWLQEFVLSIEGALPKSTANKKLIILLFESDIGKMVGLMVHRETSIQHNLICLDELFLQEGDWIDIGERLQEGQAFPVTVKSLVFNQNKEYSTKS